MSVLNYEKNDKKLLVVSEQKQKFKINLTATNINTKEKYTMDPR